MTSKHNLPRYYWDACLFISLVEATPGRIDLLRTLIAECQSGEAEILTSILTIGEVVGWRSKTNANQIDPECQKNIDLLWAPDTCFKLVEYYREIALEAREITRRSIFEILPKINPRDAIHIATAIRFNAKAFYTYDKKLINHDGNFNGLKICLPVLPPSKLLLSFSNPTPALPEPE